jgi:hypothetical protein
MQNTQIVRINMQQYFKWFVMNHDKVWKYDEPDGMPPEGITVMTSDGDHYHTMYYIMSGEYRWINIVNDDEAPLPFIPTKWRFIALPEHIIYKNI